MPYNYDPNLDPNNQPGGGQGNTQLAGGGTVTGGQGTVSGGGNTPGSPAPTSPGNYQNLNSYLDANAGNGFGQQFLSNVNNDVNAAGTAQTQAADQFKGASDAGTVKANSDLVNQAVTDPYGFSQDPNNVSAFQGQTGATYTGPQSYQDDQAAYQQASGATQKAENTAQAAQTEGGRFALLNNYFGSPNYNQGQQSLDNLLIQGDPTTAQGINQARQNADQAQIAFQNQSAPLQQYAAQNNATTQATANAANTAGNNAISGMQTDYAKALSDAQTSRQKAFSDLQAAFAQGPSAYESVLGAQGLNKGPSDPYNLAYMGGLGPNGVPTSTPMQPPSLLQNGANNPKSLLALNQSSNYWGVPLAADSAYIQQGINPTASNVLSLAQQQKLDALQGLMKNPETPFNAQEAGAYASAKPYTFDANAFNQAMQTAAGQYQSAQTNAENNIMQLIQHPSNIRAGSGGIGLGGALQNQYESLNKIRASYGLPPVENPWHGIDAAQVG